MRRPARRPAALRHVRAAAGRTPRRTARPSCTLEPAQQRLAEGLDTAGEDGVRPVEQEQVEGVTDRLQSGGGAAEGDVRAGSAEQDSEVTGVDVDDDVGELRRADEGGPVARRRPLEVEQRLEARPSGSEHDGSPLRFSGRLRRMVERGGCGHRGEQARAREWSQSAHLQVGAGVEAVDRAPVANVAVQPRADERRGAVAARRDAPRRRDDRGHVSARARTSDVLLPPKAYALFITVSSGSDRGAFGTTSQSHSGPGGRSSTSAAPSDARVRGRTRPPRARSRRRAHVRSAP